MDYSSRRELGSIEWGGIYNVSIGIQLQGPYISRPWSAFNWDQAWIQIFQSTKVNQKKFGIREFENRDPLGTARVYRMDRSASVFKSGSWRRASKFRERWIDIQFTKINQP